MSSRGFRGLDRPTALVLSFHWTLKTQPSIYTDFCCWWCMEIFTIVLSGGPNYFVRPYFLIQKKIVLSKFQTTQSTNESLIKKPISTTAFTSFVRTLGHSKVLFPPKFSFLNVTSHNQRLCEDREHGFHSVLFCCIFRVTITEDMNWSVGNENERVNLSYSGRKNYSVFVFKMLFSLISVLP